MSKFKYEWPYILILSKTDVTEYQSDFPENPDSFEIQPIIPSEGFQEFISDSSYQRVYTTPDDFQAQNEFLNNNVVWGTIYGGCLFASLLKSTHWYNTNIIHNYTYFRSESWGRYFRLRFFNILFTSWTCFHFLYMRGSFRNYPKLI